MLFEVVQDSTTGTTKSTNYWWDGKSVFMVLVVQQNGSYVAEMRHKNGAIWKKRYGCKVVYDFQDPWEIIFFLLLSAYPYNS